MPKHLAQITDDPRINVDPKMYDIINKSLVYYRGDEKKVRFNPSVENNDTRKDTYVKEREYDSLNMAKRVAARLASICFGKQAEYSFRDANIGDYVNSVLTAS